MDHFSRVLDTSARALDKTGLVVPFDELEHKNLLITNQQFLGPVPLKIYNSVLFVANVLQFFS